MPINVAKVYSILGNPKSLIPLAVKDMSSTAGMTAGSFITGKEEGQDRLIDELGTEFIWLLGIPMFKKLFDLTAFKAFGLDAKIDARNLKDADVFEKIKEYAPTEKIKASLEKAEKKAKLFKGASTAKFFVSTALTVASYIGLTKFKQNYTEKQIRQNLINEYAQKKTKEAENAEKEAESEKITNPSFKGVGQAIESFAFNPVRNMWILDACITGERLRNSRTPQEYTGYAIKEGSLLFFMYFLGGKIQDLMEKRATKKYNKSIGLDARVIESPDFQKAFENGSIQKCLDEFDAIKPLSKEGSKLTKNPVELYEFIHKNPENMIVKVAKQSDIIQMLEDTNKIDTRKYIDLESVEGVYNKLKELYSQYKTSLAKGESSEAFFKGVKRLKRGSIRTNILSSIFALGILTPAVMVAKRFKTEDDAEFETKKKIREQLIEEGIIK